MTNLNMDRILDDTWKLFLRYSYGTVMYKSFLGRYMMKFKWVDWMDEQLLNIGDD